MNNASKVVGTLIHYSVKLRDTLEYTLPKEKYDVNAYQDKKRCILVEVNENTPLKNIINNSGENGANLEKRIRDFYELVYGDSSTVLQLANDGLRVDHNQHMTIFEEVTYIHEQIHGMIMSILADASKKGEDVKAMAELESVAEEMYRGVAFLSLFETLVKFFGEFNKAMQESKGVPSPSSNFIGQDISKIIALINTVRATSRITNLFYKDVEDKMFFICENMTGRRDLPQGKGFGDVINDTRKAIQSFVNATEPKFKNKFVPLMQELIDDAKAEAAGQKSAEPAQGNSEGLGNLEIDPVTGLPKA